MRPTLARVRSLLAYDPVTGQFTRLRAAGRSPAGPVVGGLTEHGYINITIDKTRQYAHRLAWLLMTGEWPVDRIDHEDQNRANNRWVNLREATHAQNLMNRGPTKRNKSGYKGVYPSGRPNFPWRTSLNANSKKFELGRFKTKREARVAHATAAKKLHGAFAYLGNGS